MPPPSTRSNSPMPLGRCAASVRLDLDDRPGRARRAELHGLHRAHDAGGLGDVDDGAPLLAFAAAADPLDGAPAALGAAERGGGAGHAPSLGVACDIRCPPCRRCGERTCAVSHPREPIRGGIGRLEPLDELGGERRGERVGPHAVAVVVGVEHVDRELGQRCRRCPGAGWSCAAARPSGRAPRRRGARCGWPRRPCARCAGSRRTAGRHQRVRGKGFEDGRGCRARTPPDPSGRCRWRRWRRSRCRARASRTAGAGPARRARRSRPRR